MQNKRRLFIVGASSFGRELESWLELIPQNEREWYIYGYIEKNKEALKDYPSNYKVVGDEDTISFKNDDLLIVSIADPVIKEKIYNKLKDNVTFFTYIAPNVVLGKFNQIGEGSIICPNCVLTTNIKIGKLVTINIGTQIGHDVKIGNFSSLMANVDISGKCELGNRVFLGTNSTIAPRKKIADDVKISVGSIVIKNIKNKSIVYGNPAKKIS